MESPVKWQLAASMLGSWFQGAGGDDHNEGIAIGIADQGRGRAYWQSDSDMSIPSTSATQSQENREGMDMSDDSEESESFESHVEEMND